MAIATKRVTGRRTLHFASLAEVSRDAETLAAAPDVTTIGNWTLGQILMHLARAMDGSIDGIDFRASWPLRLVGRWMRNRFLLGPMPAGLQLPEHASRALVSDADLTTSAALDALRKAIQRQATEAHREPHGVFGRLSRQQWEQLHLRHSELHLSFVRPR